MYLILLCEHSRTRSFNIIAAEDNIEVLIEWSIIFVPSMGPCSFSSVYHIVVVVRVTMLLVSCVDIFHPGDL